MAGEHIVGSESPIDIQLYPQLRSHSTPVACAGEGVTPVGAKEALKVAASPGVLDQIWMIWVSLVWETSFK